MYVCEYGWICKCICTYVLISAKIQVWKYKPQTVNNDYLGQDWTWNERRKGDKK